MEEQLNASEALGELLKRLEARRNLQREDDSLAIWDESAGLDAAIAQAHSLLAEVIAQCDRQKPFGG